MLKAAAVLIDKPIGLTSRDVVNIISKKLQIKKIGHAGTLDPQASGLLILLLNKATRFTRFINSVDKIYSFCVNFCTQTTTDDIEGEIIKKNIFPDPGLDIILQTLKLFRGKFEQIPPNYSAVKYKGQRAYKLARKGISFKLNPRTVEISQLAVLTWEWPKVEILAKVSSGTYIRSLVRDIGNKSGYGAYASDIRRITIGNISVEQAEKIENMNEFSYPEIHSLDNLLPDYRTLYLNENDVNAFKEGQYITCDENDEILLIRDTKDNIIGIAEKIEEGRYKPEVVIK